MNKLKGFKQTLPTKICNYCGKLFQYRKKWKRDWAEVKFCSQKCKNPNKSTPQKTTI